MNDLLNLISGEYVVLDGAFGTQLQERGLKAGEIPEEWNIKMPEVVRDIHLSYYRAGAQVVSSNTFGASPLKLQMKNRENDSEELNRRGIEIVREALDIFLAGARDGTAGEKDIRFVAGSVGPSGRVLGMDVTPDEVDRCFGFQADVMARAGADLFMVETMMDLGEAAIAVKALKRETGLPVFASLVFNKTKKGEYRTLFGNSTFEAASRLLESGADAVGANCGLLEEYIGVIAEMRSVSSAPLVLYPNAGLPRLLNGETVFDVSAQDLIRGLDDSLEAGASIVGGCCGTTPEYIGLLASRIKGKNRTR